MDERPSANVKAGLKRKWETPQVSQDDFLSFFQAHFSEASVNQFDETFLKPTDTQEAPEDEFYDDFEEEDDLGYYDDGVKRTLTDEQIAIFRHSELQTLRRQQERDAARTKRAGSAQEETSKSPAEQATVQQDQLPSTFRSNKKKKKKAGNRQKPEPKPDLRKRTWDIVDKGLDSLDYD